MLAMAKLAAMPNFAMAANTVWLAPVGDMAHPTQAAPPSSMPAAMVLCLHVTAQQHENTHAACQATAETAISITATSEH